MHRKILGLLMAACFVFGFGWIVKVEAVTVPLDLNGATLAPGLGSPDGGTTFRFMTNGNFDPDTETLAPGRHQVTLPAGTLDSVLVNHLDHEATNVSPDGQWAVLAPKVVISGATSYLIHLPDGAEITIPPPAGSPLSSVEAFAVANDGTVAVRIDGVGAGKYSPSTGQTVLLGDPVGISFSFTGAVTPDGIVFVGASGGPVISETATYWDASGHHLLPTPSGDTSLARGVSQSGALKAGTLNFGGGAVFWDSTDSLFNVPEFDGIDPLSAQFIFDEGIVLGSALYGGENRVFFSLTGGNPILYEDVVTSVTGVAPTSIAHTLWGAGIWGDNLALLTNIDPAFIGLPVSDVIQVLAENNQNPNPLPEPTTGMMGILMLVVAGLYTSDRRRIVPV